MNFATKRQICIDFFASMYIIKYEFANSGIEEMEEML